MAKGSVSLAIELPESKLLNIKCSPGGTRLKQFVHYSLDLCVDQLKSRNRSCDHISTNQSPVSVNCSLLSEFMGTWNHGEMCADIIELDYNSMEIEYRWV